MGLIESILNYDLWYALEHYTFVQNMFLAGLLASIACGIIGTYVVVKRIVFIGGGIAHTTFGGIGMAYYFGFEPMIGAAIFAIFTAVSVGLVNLKTRIREDSTIGILWVVGMALGIIFIKKTDGYIPDPMSILFGNILLVSEHEIKLMVVLLVIIIAATFLFYKDLLALTFDEEFATISGIHTGLMNVVLLCLTALTIVLLLKVVGVVLVIAMLTIPASISGLITKSLKKMMAFAVVIGCLLTFFGLVLSWEYDLPPGATIVLLSGGAFLLSCIAKWIHNRVLSGRMGGTPSQ